MPKIEKSKKPAPIVAIQPTIKDVESSSDDESTESEQEEPIHQPVVVQQKPQKQKRNYVMTDARKLAFEKAQQKRAENIALRKQLKEKEQAEFEKIKQEKEAKKAKKEAKKKELELKKLELLSDESEVEEEEEEQIIVKKKKKPAKKKVIIYISDDEQDEKNIIIVNKLDSKPQIPPQPQKPKRTTLFL